MKPIEAFAALGFRIQEKNKQKGTSDYFLQKFFISLIEKINLDKLHICPCDLYNHIRRLGSNFALNKSYNSIRASQGNGLTGQSSQLFQTFFQSLLNFFEVEKLVNKKVMLAHRKAMLVNRKVKLANRKVMLAGQRQGDLFEF